MARQPRLRLFIPDVTSDNGCTQRRRVREGMSMAPILTLAWTFFVLAMWYVTKLLGTIEEWIADPAIVWAGGVVVIAAVKYIVSDDD
jgi:hypothetical protein